MQLLTLLFLISSYTENNWNAVKIEIISQLFPLSTKKDIHNVVECLITRIISTIFGDNDRNDMVRENKNSYIRYSATRNRMCVSEITEIRRTRKIPNTNFETMPADNLGHDLLTKIIWTNIRLRSWIDDYMHVKEWDVFTHLCRTSKAVKLSHLCR